MAAKGKVHNFMLTVSDLMFTRVLPFGRKLMICQIDNRGFRIADFGDGCECDYGCSWRRGYTDTYFSSAHPSIQNSDKRHLAEFKKCKKKGANREVWLENGPEQEATK